MKGITTLFFIITFSLVNATEKKSIKIVRKTIIIKELTDTTDYYKRIRL